MTIETADANAAESSTAGENEANVAAQAGAEATPDANAAESSNADEKDAKPASLLDVVKDAIKKEEPAAAAPSAAEGEGEAPAEAEKKPETAEEQAEADRKLPFHEHPRWKEVLAERDSYRDDASSFREITGYMRQHGLTGDEVTEGFDIMAKLKSGSPEGLAEAREYFSSRLALLDDALGNVLPDDLKTKVEAGEIDEDAAKEVARLRAETKLRTAGEERRTEADAAEQARAVNARNAEACATAVDQWEAEAKKADPDYAKKADLIELACRAIAQERGLPKNPTEAVQLAKDAKERVDRQLKAALPTPKPVKRDPVGSSATAVTQPKTLREAVQAALGQ
jgi:hypothetical protein